MVSFEEAVNQQLCKSNDILAKIKMLLESKEMRDTDIVFITIPEDAGTRQFALGTTKIDFRTGTIVNPDGTQEFLQTKLDSYGLLHLHSLSVDTNQDITIKLDGRPKRTISANFSTQIPYLTYSTLEVTCTVISDLQIFACTNPSAVIGQFKVTTVNILDQNSINGDTTEAQTWDTVSNLINNLNRIRKKLNDIIGGVSWTDPVSGSLASLPATYAPIANGVTNGDSHNHNGGDGAQIDHTTLSNIGTNTHAQIDTYIAASAPHPGHAIITTGTYTGDGTQNRAIPHGLGRVPKLVIVITTNAGQMVMNYIDNTTHGHYESGSTTLNDTRAAWDSTNFYVGDPGGGHDNGSGGTYQYSWVAIG